MSSPSRKLENAAPAAPLSQTTSSALPASRPAQEAGPGQLEVPPLANVPATSHHGVHEQEDVAVDVAVAVEDAAPTDPTKTTNAIHPSSSPPVTGLGDVPRLPVRPAPHVSPSVPGTPEPNNASPKTPVLPSTTTTTDAPPAASPVDPSSNKKSRPPMPPFTRSNGPSLLTQALASARGIPAATNSHTTQTEPRRPEQKSAQPSDGARGTQPKPSLDTRVTSHDDSSSQSGGASLTPKGFQFDSNSALSTSPTSLTSPEVALPSPSEMPGRTSTIALHDGSRHLLADGIARPRSLERTDKEVRTHQLNANGGYSTNVGDTALSHGELQRDLRALILDQETPSDPRIQYRTWRADRTLSMGPEKAWSIGRGDLVGAQAGQVEKSITEALAGLEPTRSRKASHSLRFFKEGLPNDHSKRKESKVLIHRPEGAVLAKEQQGEGVSQKLGEASFPPSSPALRPAHDPTSPPTDASKIQPDGPGVESPLEESHDADYFSLPQPTKEFDKPRPLSPLFEVRPVSEGIKDDVTSNTAIASKEGGSSETRRQSGDSTEVGDTPEEGDDSGEEKISSAVFVPHQEVPEIVQPKTGRPLLVHRPSVAKDTSPWLVKADEPEAEDESLGQTAQDASPEAPEKLISRGMLNQVDDDVAVEEDVALPPISQAAAGRLSRPVSQYYDDHVHDHQFTPKKPLEAIELIPYKHQVGGHTTIWRFSKRAVCKQLNNSENKFYENIERYHRDLLPFLPRSDNPPFTLQAVLFPVAALSSSS